MTFELNAVLQGVHALITICVIVGVVTLFRRPQKREMRIAQLETDQLDLLMRIQKLSGRIGRAARDENQETDTDVVNRTTWAQRKGETPEQWKLRTRALLQKGVKPGAA